MMKKTFNFLLMAALVCGMSLSVTSCKSDDDDNNGGGGSDSEVLEGELSDEAVLAWSWVSVLTDAAEQPAGWQSQSFDATIGVQSSNDPMARLIFVADLDGAKANFANIAGCEVEELNGTKTVSAGEFGSLTWNISAPGAKNIATVEVNSPLLKKLERIIYCTEDQAPENAAPIKGNCFYHIGDVIETPDGYYWVCVQPSFEGKKNYDSYWVNVFNASANGKGAWSEKTPGIPAKNIYSKYNKNSKYNNNIIKLPTGLKMDRQQNFNFSNLIWALVNPDQYLTDIGAANITTGLAGLPKQYHGERFLTVVRNAWRRENLFEKVLNRTEKQLAAMERLNFFYNGYHWKTGTKAGVWIYRSTAYWTKISGSQKKDDTLFEMKTKGYGFDVLRYVSSPDADKDCASTGKKDMAPATQFTDKEGYWVIRVATGKQLDKNYTPYTRIAGAEHSYVFNSDMMISSDAEEPVPLLLDSDIEIPTIIKN